MDESFPSREVTGKVLFPAAKHYCHAWVSFTILPHHSRWTELLQCPALPPSHSSLFKLVPLHTGCLPGWINILQPGEAPDKPTPRPKLFRYFQDNLPMDRSTGEIWAVSVLGAHCRSPLPATQAMQILHWEDSHSGFRICLCFSIPTFPGFRKEAGFTRLQANQTKTLLLFLCTFYNQNVFFGAKSLPH